MAITLADFTKIWASTSPLTPYSFSDSNYQEGWNFVGATPPARQMWDSIQKQNDEKMKYIVDNFLPTSGGTMTGSIVMSADLSISASADNQSISVNGGTAWDKGACLSVWGKEHATYPGYFALHANDGTNDYAFTGEPNGSLLWNGDSVGIIGNLANGHGIIMGNKASISVSADNYTTGTISFGKTFSSAPIVVTCVASGHAHIHAGVGSVTTTSFNYIVSSEGASQTVSINWIAIG